MTPYLKRGPTHLSTWKSPFNSMIQLYITMRLSNRNFHDKNARYVQDMSINLDFTTNANTNRCFFLPWSPRQTWNSSTNFHPRLSPWIGRQKEHNNIYINPSHRNDLVKDRIIPVKHPLFLLRYKFVIDELPHDDVKPLRMVAFFLSVRHFRSVINGLDHYVNSRSAPKWPRDLIL